MKRKRLLAAARRELCVQGEQVIIEELKKLKAPWWLRLVGLFKPEKLRAWYKAQEARIESGVLRAEKNIYRRAKK